MEVISVNVGAVRDVIIEGRADSTGIVKKPAAGRVFIGAAGLAGDARGPRSMGADIHAVYAYPVEHYGFWEKELGVNGYPLGQFGENLTVRGLAEDNVRVGDVLRIGTALLQVTAPRIPCYKLADHMGQGPGFPARFLKSLRSGFYFRVLEEGDVGTGDAIELVERNEGAATIADFVRVTHLDTGDIAGLERLLASPTLAEGWQQEVSRLLDGARSDDASGKVPWTGLRTLVVDRREKESETVTSFYLKPKDGRPLPAYKPGQFLTVELAVPSTDSGQDTPVIRTYTLSDSPNHPDSYRLTIKREPAAAPDLPAGVASNYFHDHVQVGTEIGARKPSGEFFLDQQSDRPVALLSGGVGLTPMISMLNTLVESGVESQAGRPVWFIHGVRNGAEHALGDHVRRLASENETVTAHVVYQQPGDGDEQGRDYDTEGFVTESLLADLLPDNDMDFYLCGPPPFMKAVYNLLLDRGVNEDRVRYEFFGPATVLKEGAQESGQESAKESAPAAPSEGPEVGIDQGVEGVSVTFAKSGKTVKWNGFAESILELAEDAGLTPDFNCRSGLCLTCMSPLLAGEVRYPEEPAADPDEGSVLLCCSVPKTDVTIDV